MITYYGSVRLIASMHCSGVEKRVQKIEHQVEHA
jgi:hypothetical protein